ncbi:hypothetical protein Tco_1453286 [Tanacetum coccineum]
MSSSTVTYTSAPPSLDYVPGLEHPPSPDYVPGPEYPEYLVPSDDEEKDPEEDLEEDPVEYHADGGDDDDDEEEEEENKEEEEHLAPDDSTTLPVVDPVPSVEDTKAFETDESALTPTHTSPTYVEAPLVATEALIAAVAAALPSSPPPSLLTSLSSPLPQIPLPSLPFLSPPLPLHAPSLPLLLPAADLAAARQPGLDVTHAINYNFVDIVDATPGCPMSREVGYGITDVWDDIVGDIEGRAQTTLEELSQRVTDLAATLARDTHEMYVRFEEAQDDRALQRARVNTLFRDKRYHLHTAMLLESEARQGTEDQRTREPEPARDLEPQDGPADVGSSCNSQLSWP